MLQGAGVNFGAVATARRLQTFDNAAGINFDGITQLSEVGINGALSAANAAEIGSPGTIVNVVTTKSLQTLVYAFSTDPSVANELNAKFLVTANAKNAIARAGQLGSFEKQVNAQTGKALTADEAAILIALSKQLL